MLPSYYRLIPHDIDLENINTQVSATPSTKPVIQAKLASVEIPSNKIVSKRTKLSLWYIIPNNTGNALTGVIYEIIPYYTAPTLSPKKLYDIRKRMVSEMQERGMIPKL